MRESMLLFKKNPIEDPLAQFAWNKIENSITIPGLDFSDAPEIMDAYAIAIAALPSLVFVNGRFSPESSGCNVEGMQILSIETAKKNYKSYFSIDLRKKVEEENKISALLNYSYSEEGLFIYLSPNQGDVTLNIRHFFTKDSGICFPRLHVIIGSNSALTLVIEQSVTKGIWVNQLIDVHLAAHAKLTLVELLDSNDGVLVDTIRAAVKESAFFDTIIVSKGADMVYRDYHAKLLGEEAEAKVHAACNLYQKKEERLQVLMELKAPQTRSFQKVKHVGQANSRHHFTGKIYVHREAQKSDSYQRHQALLLDAFAFQTVKPELEIFADDVKASHGASCGSLNQEELFYFASRGIEKKLAQSLLIQGHLQEIINGICDPIARKRASEITR